MPETFQPKTSKKVTVGNGVIIVSMDEDAMLAAITLRTDGHSVSFSLEQVLDALGQMEIVRGVDQERIGELLASFQNEGAPVEQEVIARGEDPSDGKDAYLEYPTLERLPAEMTESGDPVRITKYSILNVREGETVAIYHPVQEGTSGWTVDGRSIPVSQPADPTPKPGQNLRWEERNLVATVDGRLVIEDRQLYVLPVIEFDKDLTLVHGDIDFVGRIVVKGNVEAGVRVACEKGMEVHGSIIGSTIDIDGDLVVGNGIVGSEETYIEVRGDLRTIFVENADLRVHGKAHIRDSFVTSRLICADAIELAEGRGHMVSGLMAARNGIRVRTVGIPLGTKAKLCVGKDPLVAERQSELKEFVAQLEGSLNRVRELDARMGPMTRTYQKLPPDKQEEIELLLEQLDRMEAQMRDAQSELEDLNARLVPNPTASITILDNIYTDAIIDFPLDVTKVTNSLKGVAYRFDDHRGKIEAQDAGDDDEANEGASRQSAEGESA